MTTRDAASGYPGQDEALFPIAPPRVAISPADFVLQRDDWSCGVATLTMVYRALELPAPSWTACIRLLGTTPEHGTSTAGMRRALDALASEHHCTVESRAGGSFEDLFRLTSAGWITTLAFREPAEGVGHWGILQALNTRALMIADPYYGGRGIVSRAQFKWTTQFETPEQRGWYGAVRRYGSGSEIPPPLTKR